MSEILSAYETVMTTNTAFDSRVALACEVMTLEQLRRTHEVYTIQVLYHDENEDRNMPSDLEMTSRHVSNNINYKLVAHADDSVSDFKHVLQEQFARDWGLDLKRTDRYGLASGWEVVLDGEPLEILGNHWFLHTYHIVHGALIYAIVRRP